MDKIIRAERYYSNTPELRAQLDKLVSEAQDLAAKHQLPAFDGLDWLQYHRMLIDTGALIEGRDFLVTVEFIPPMMVCKPGEPMLPIQ